MKLFLTIRVWLHLKKGIIYTPYCVPQCRVPPWSQCPARAAIRFLVLLHFETQNHQSVIFGRGHDVTSIVVGSGSMFLKVPIPQQGVQL